MLKTFLNNAANHLNPHGQIWLIMSDIAEHLGLRSPQALNQWIAAAGLALVRKSDIEPQHPKAQQQHNPLAYARNQEITSLWQLTVHSK